MIDEAPHEMWLYIAVITYNNFFSFWDMIISYLIQDKWENCWIQKYKYQIWQKQVDDKLKNKATIFFSIW